MSKNDSKLKKPITSSPLAVVQSDFGRDSIASPTGLDALAQASAESSRVDAPNLLCHESQISPYSTIQRGNARESFATSIGFSSIGATSASSIHTNSAKASWRGSQVSPYNTIQRIGRDSLAVNGLDTIYGGPSNPTSPNILRHETFARDTPASPRLVRQKRRESTLTTSSGGSSSLRTLKLSNQSIKSGSSSSIQNTGSSSHAPDYLVFSHINNRLEIVTQTPPIIAPSSAHSPTTAVNPDFPVISPHQRVVHHPSPTKSFSFPQPSSSIQTSPGPPSIHAIQSLFSSALPRNTHPDRPIYALAGKLFHPGAPAPFGGKKSKPGYTSFTGSAASELLEYIVGEAFAVYRTGKGKEALEAVRNACNDIIALGGLLLEKMRWTNGF
ncbi:hypothetical protein BCR33DRAFT_732982 [Rhizoclosmatium globosum]|uniref:Uncharacterized protein n=1 Tax=Rhizoclosmatium globosum TaxID=329046 RepID=A0A1Y2D1U6_9FUNG|nr:hypothetical protein BCR33DRAFT_732982 [Rhizoclosmatium globosum]|eukprot:ORY53230.1 hypothetical protein BCR33DRAFT_732982 [Rhizoclosmatium globosum]